jgi:glycosyltransferase involved in cell wall biosynthesis
MEIFDISPFGVYPPKVGGHIRIHNLNLELSRRGNKIFLFSQCIRAYELKLHLKSWVTKINNNYTEYRYVNKVSLGTYFITDKMGLPPIFAGDVLNLIRPRILGQYIERCDVIKVEHPWQFSYIHKINKKNIPIIIVEHNAEFELARNTIKRFVPKKFYEITLNKERFALEKSDLIFVTSEEDKKKLVEFFGIDESKFSIIPNGVNIANFQLSDKIKKEEMKKRMELNEKKVILFIGSKHLPNVEAIGEIIRFSKKIENKNIVFLVAGRGSETFKNIKKDNILFTGYIDDITPYFKAADIAINPMLSGSGTNIKMLEYMASGLPVISTPIGARGLDIVNNEHAIIANIDDFPEKLEELLNDEEMQKNLSQNGRKLVEEKYDWGKIAEKEMEILEKLT